MPLLLIEGLRYVRFPNFCLFIQIYSGSLCNNANPNHTNLKTKKQKNKQKKIPAFAFDLRDEAHLLSSMSDSLGFRALSSLFSPSPTDSLQFLLAQRASDHFYKILKTGFPVIKGVWCICSDSAVL